jgi:prevent-host-death family protein
MEPKMSTLISLAEAQPKLQELIDEVSISREPITITGKTHNAILVSEEIWQGIQETIYLLSIPEVGESIKVGLLTPVSECSEELDW